MGFRDYIVDKACDEARRTPDGRMHVGSFLDKYYEMERKMHEEPSDAMKEDIKSVLDEVDKLLGNFVNDEKLSRITYLLSLLEEVNHADAMSMSPTLNYVMERGKLINIRWKRDGDDLYAVLEFEVRE